MDNPNEDGGDLSTDYGVLVRSISKRKTEQVRFSLCEYTNRKYIDIRIYYLDRGSSEFKPSRKGVTLPISAYPELMKSVVELGDALDQMESNSNSGSSETG